MRWLIKRESSSDNMLLFLVSSAFSVLGVRIFLETFGYPQIQHGELHLAHALTGAILLALANILLITYHGKHVRRLGAVIGGLGFGQMIDEVGKFITKDNNYFYQPVPMIIYLVFIGLFFWYRHFDTYQPAKPKEILYETLEKLEEVVENVFRPSTQHWLQQALHALPSSNQNYQILSATVAHSLGRFSVHAQRPNHVISAMRRSWKWLDNLTTEKKQVWYFLVSVFVVYVGIAVVSTTTFLHTLWLRGFAHVTLAAETRIEVGFVLAQLTSQTIAAFLMFRGFLFALRHQKTRALHLFRTGLAVRILITHVFTFYFQQFAALKELFLLIGVFTLVQNMLDEDGDDETS